MDLQALQETGMVNWVDLEVAGPTKQAETMLAAAAADILEAAVLGCGSILDLAIQTEEMAAAAAVPTFIPAAQIQPRQPVNLPTLERLMEARFKTLVNTMQGKAISR
jgi:hypothetical protein